MPPNWFVWASPLILLGVPLILFADRNLEHQRTNMQNGKEYIWQYEFQPKLGDLIYELDNDLDLSSEIEQLRDEFEDRSRPNPDGVNSEEDIPRKILSNAPFTPALRDVTETIGEHTARISELENHYEDLEGHLRALGLSFVGTYVILIGAQSYYGTPLPEWVLLGAVFVLFLGGQEAYRYIKKKRSLREYSDKYERRRNI